MKKLFLGNNATETCYKEVATYVPLNHPDLLVIKSPHTIDAVDAWIDALYTSPIILPRRYGVLEDAHELSETALGRMLEVLESTPNYVDVWLTSKRILTGTIHSRLMTVCTLGDSNLTEWRGIISNCKRWLVGSTSSKLWEEWHRILQLYTFALHNLPEYKCLEEARRFRISTPI